MSSAPKEAQRAGEAVLCGETAFDNTCVCVNAPGHEKHGVSHAFVTREALARRSAQRAPEAVPCCHEFANGRPHFAGCPTQRASEPCPHGIVEAPFSSFCGECQRHRTEPASPREACPPEDMCWRSEELIAEAFGIEEGAAPGKTAGQAIDQIRKLWKVAEAARVFVDFHPVISFTRDAVVAQ